MVDIAAENKYISYVMNKISTDNVEKESYTVQKGDNLWNLAKKELEKTGKASNQEISNYMLLIAKLNGLDTYEKMNSLKYDQTIFMPDTDVKSAREYIGLESVQKELTAAEKSLYQTLELLKSDEVEITKRYSGASDVEVYIAQKEDKDIGFPTTAASIYTKGHGKDMKILQFAFEDSEENIQPERLDYTMYENGQIVRSSYSRYSAEKNGAIKKIDNLGEVTNTLKDILSTKALDYSIGTTISLNM